RLAALAVRARDPVALDVHAHAAGLVVARALDRAPVAGAHHHPHQAAAVPGAVPERRLDPHPFDAARDPHLLARGLVPAGDPDAARFVGAHAVAVVGTGVHALR